MGKDPKSYYHDKGEKDAGDRDYDPPHGIVDELTTWTRGGMEKNSEENRAYDQGYFNSRGQSDGARNSYNPPSDSDAKEAYDNAWRSSYDETHKKGCFLSEACCAFAGLPDDCRELTVLRAFRDQHLLGTESGRQLVTRYYDIAQDIVNRVQQSASPGDHWAFVYACIGRVVEDIEQGHHAEAVTKYQSMVETLRGQLLELALGVSYEQPA